MLSQFGRDELFCAERRSLEYMQLCKARAATGCGRMMISILPTGYGRSASTSVFPIQYMYISGGLFESNKEKQGKRSIVDVITSTNNSVLESSRQKAQTKLY